MKKLISQFEVVLFVSMLAVPGHANWQEKVDEAYKKTAAMVQKSFSYLTLKKWGLGVGGNFNMSVVGPVYNLEFLNFGPHMSSSTVYCAPGVSGAAGANAGLSYSIIKPMGCYSPQDYTGNFITFALGLPLKIGGVSYSFGANVDQALQNLERQKEDGEFLPGMIDNEINLIYRVLDSHVDGLQASAIRLVLRLFQSLLMTFSSKKLDASVKSHSANNYSEFTQALDQENLENFEGAVTANYELIHQTILAIPKLGFMNAYAPNFMRFYNAIVATFSMCNSIAISVGFGPSYSLFGVVPNASVTHYTLISDRENETSFNPISILYDLTSSMVKDVYKNKWDLVKVCPDSAGWIWKDSERMFDLFGDPVRSQPPQPSDLEGYFDPNQEF